MHAYHLHLSQTHTTLSIMFNSQVNLNHPANWQHTSTNLSSKVSNIPLPQVKLGFGVRKVVRHTTVDLNDYYLGVIRSNDRLEFTKMYEHFLKKAQIFITQRGGRLEDAQDVFQEAFMIVVDKVRKNTLTLTCPLSSYLLRICRNIWLNKAKKKTNQSMGLTQESYENGENEIDEQINEALKTRLYKEKFTLLSQDQQKVLHLFMEGCSMQEIAKKMGYASAKYAKKKKFLAQKQLIQLVKADPLYLELVG